MEIRRAREEDIEQTLSIYNDEVEHGVATLDIHNKTIEEWKEWFSHHDEDTHPIYVSEENGRITGYVSLSPYREKEAYCSTVELSLYIHREYRKQGIAGALMKTILQDAHNNPRIHTIVSVITRGNEASTRLHEKYGFTFCGTIHQVGMKFGRYLDIDNYELIKEN